jgi:hypothetical protein
LHIEDSQIYHSEDKTEIVEEEKENQADKTDLYVGNKALYSEAHMGSEVL